MSSGRSVLDPRDPGVRRRIRVAGVVQGVGFRPFVYRLASEMGLGGIAGNDSRGVFIEVEGPASAVSLFQQRLCDDAPPLSRVDEIQSEPLVPIGEVAFRIVGSRQAGAARTFVSPDVAVCDDCLGEMRDAGDRRYRYPFINCTNCGPRFTITIRLPYDRPNTTMSGFTMCPACAAEYDDPANRRFHAQPLACAECGPQVFYESGGEAQHGTDSVIAAAQADLAAGRIVAIKGLGGYHLACTAVNPAAVATLRDRKRRPGKPLAVMVSDLAQAETLAYIDSAEAALLQSRARPIVLLRRRPEAPISDLVAPGHPYVGVFLPYTPLHHLLFIEVPEGGGPVPGPLVMTSGNLTEEPICFEEADARRRLGSIADSWLWHDRRIHVPCDDSVARVIDGEEVPVRRSRGYAPLPVRLPVEVEPTLAAGGELKNTFCLGSGRDAWLSQHIGDMGSLETLAAFERSVTQFEEIYEVAPLSAAVDAHPGYTTREWALRRGLPFTSVQHHHAHIAGVMAEHGVADGEKVLGFAFDGTGYGDDGAIWGGEVLAASYRGYDRLAHLKYVPLPGGDAAIRKPYRTALAHLRAAGVEWAPDLAPVAAAGADELRVLDRQLERGFQCVPTSSMGRLFDAVSSLLDIRHTVSYEAQAAIELEVAAEAGLASPRPYRFDPGPVVDPGPVLVDVVSDLRAGVAVECVSAGFHVAVADLIVAMAADFCARLGDRRVALSGGVFQNALLVRLVRSGLDAEGLVALTHRLVPPNDGGLALGQLVIAGLKPSSARHDGRDG